MTQISLLTISATSLTLVQISLDDPLLDIILICAVVLALERQKEDESSKRKPFTVDELDWFSRNAYNLALKNTATWELRFVVRMLTACANIIGHFPSDIGSKGEL